MKFTWTNTRWGKVINKRQNIRYLVVKCKAAAEFIEWQKKKKLMIPGEYVLAQGNIECNVGRPTVKIAVVNTGDRPVQVGSHFHFFEVNKQMQFDREKAFGMRLNIAAGTAVRFEPGEEKEVELVTFGGSRKVFGFSNLTNGETTSPALKEEALLKALSQNFKDTTK